MSKYRNACLGQLLFFTQDVTGNSASQIRLFSSSNKTVSWEEYEN